MTRWMLEGKKRVKRDADLMKIKYTPVALWKASAKHKNTQYRRYRNNQFVKKNITAVAQGTSKMPQPATNDPYRRLRKEHAIMSCYQSGLTALFSIVSTFRGS